MLAAPEVLYTGDEPNFPALLKRPINAIWNACGIKCLPNFDEAGNWTARRRGPIRLPDASGVADSMKMGET